MIILQDAENNWQYDIFGFADATQTLSMLTFHLYKQAGLITDFNLNEQKLCNFLQKSGHRAENPLSQQVKQHFFPLLSSPPCKLTFFESVLLLMSPFSSPKLSLFSPILSHPLLISAFCPIVSVIPRVLLRRCEG